MDIKYKSFDDLPFVLTVDQFAQLMRISKPTAYDMIHSNQVKAITIGRQYRIPKESIRDLVASCFS